MALTDMIGWELLEEYKNGKRVFSDINMQFSDLTGANLEGMTIKNSKLYFVLLRESNLKKCRFINCDMFSCGFRNADLSNALFEKCKIDYGYFQNAMFDNTKMTRCNLSWCGLFSAKGSLDTSTSTLFKVFTNISDLTQADIDAAFRGLTPFIQNLDFEIKSQVQNLLKSVTDKIGIEPTKSDPSAYGKSSNSYTKPLSVYQMMEQLITDYARKTPYKAKTPYEKTDNYRK